MAHRPKQKWRIKKNNPRTEEKTSNNDNTERKEFVYNKKINMEPKMYTNHNVSCKDSDYNVLRILSWNLCSIKHSKFATKEWIQNNNKYKLIYSQIIKQNPDIIALQELPQKPQSTELLKYFLDTKQWFISRSFITHHMVNEPSDGAIILINKRLSKYYDIMYSKEDTDDIKYNDIDNLHEWPGVILYDKYNHKLKLLLYCVHFIPGKQLFNERRQEFDELYAESKRNGMHSKFACIGDVNMRENEEGYIKRKYGLASCWDIIPKWMKSDSFFTWHWNYYKMGNNDYSLRYDRMFFPKHFKCKRVHIFDEAVSEYDKHFLSDHRGIVVTIKI